MFGTVMRSSLSIWMTNLNLMSRSFRKCFTERLHLLVQNGLPVRHPGSPLRNVQLSLASIGISGSVKTATFVPIVASMASVASVEADTERKTNRNARLLSKLVQEKEELMTAERARAAKEGPRSLEPRGEKRKADAVPLPKFRRGYAWGDSSTKNLDNFCLIKSNFCTH